MNRISKALCVAGAVAAITAAAVGPAFASTTFAGIPSSRTQVSANGVTLYVGETVSTGRRAYVITGVQSDPAAGSVTFELNQALPVRDLHKSVPFTIGS